MSYTHNIFKGNDAMSYSINSITMYPNTHSFPGHTCGEFRNTGAFAVSYKTHRHSSNQ